jgi:hypothetical protein
MNHQQCSPSKSATFTLLAAHLKVILDNSSFALCYRASAKSCLATYLGAYVAIFLLEINRRTEDSY